MTRIPYIFCPVCQFFEECGDAGWGRRRPMFQCYRDDRTMDLDLQRQHLERVAAVEGVELPVDYTPRILDLVHSAQGRLARPLEFSVTWNREEEHWCRFSVVYWERARDSQRRDLQHALATARLFGPLEEGGILEVLDDVIMEEGPILQLLYGVDLRTAGTRQKLYIRLGHGEAAWKDAMIRRLVPAFHRDLAPLPLDILRMVGIDLHVSGEAPPEVKLYFITGQMSWERGVALAGHHPFLEFIRGRCPDLRELIMIQRLAADAPVEPRIDGVELHLLRNLLDLKAIWTYLHSQGSPCDLRRFLGMYRAALVVPTSVAFQARGMDRMNLYYLMVRPRRGA